MISKERIDELIQQKAKIWGIGKQGNVFCIGLKFRPHTLNNKKWLENKYEVYSKFFETKEEAEWHKEFGNIERTERLELPTWEDVVDYFKVMPNSDYEITFISDDLIYSICITDDITIYMKDFEDFAWDIIFDEVLTKENYTLACRKAKELFLGE